MRKSKRSGPLSIDGDWFAESLPNDMDVAELQKQTLSIISNSPATIASSTTTKLFRLSRFSFGKSMKIGLWGN
ncbi:unnamed protein product [Amoebophrya sp. A25]|nr:unnamed protein product [Amoebophrya sp. A25]|eukprot:GSA25T00007333001.1